jgi:predicted permease
MPINTDSLLGIGVPFLTILILLLTGAALRRWGMVTRKGAGEMTRLVINVTLPPLIMITLATEITPAELSRAPLLVGMGILGPLVGYLVAAGLGRLPGLSSQRRATLQATIAMLNTTFVGYPVCKALLGDRGLLYAVFYDAGFTLVMSTLSVWLMSWSSRNGTGKLLDSARDLLRSPMLWSVVVGLMWGAFGWPMPEWIRTPLATLGQATTPLALLTVGMLAAPTAPHTVERDAEPAPRRPIERLQLGLLTAARLLVTPALMWVLVVLLRVERAAAAVIVLQTAMPTAVASTAMSEQYGGDSTFAATAVVATTFLSLLTLPAWAWALLGS